MNDPVLDRAMFRNQAPVSSYGTGITSNVASPDENARALQMAFQPTGYAGGGQVINGVKHFQQGGENVSGGRSFLGGMFRLPDPSTVLTPRRYTPVMQAQEDAAALEPSTPSTPPMNPEDVIVPQRYGTVRSGSTYGTRPTPLMAEMSPEDAAAAAYDQDVRDQRPSPFSPGSPAEKSYFRREAFRAPTGREVRVRVQDSILQTPEAKAAIDMMDEGQRRKDPTLYAQGQRTLDQLTEQGLREAGIQDTGIATIPVKDAEASKKAAAAAAARFDAGVSPTDVPSSPAAATATAAPPADKAGAGAGAKKPDEESGLGKRLSLRIDELKQEREANKAQRRENQLLALMQAGFQAAAGKSSSALTNIAGGGAAGIATLADLEKTRRAEDTALRSESLQLELAKEKMLESSKERAAALAERGLSRDITGLKAVSDANKGLIISYENQILALEKLQDAPATPDDKKKEYGQLIAQKRAEIDRLGFEYRQQAQGLLPKGMRTPNLDFPTTVRGSRPTQAGT